MKKIATAFAIALLSFASAGVAMAQRAAEPPAAVDTSGLSATQVAELNALAEKAREETPIGRAEQANEWVEIGQGIGSGLAAAARETGQVVNEFAATPVGQLTIVIILFKVMGGDIIQLIVGLLYFAVTIPIWYSFYKKLWPYTTVVTVYDETTKKRTTTKSRAKVDWSDDNGVMICLGWLAFAAIGAGGIWIIFA